MLAHQMLSPGLTTEKGWLMTDSKPRLDDNVRHLTNSDVAIRSLHAEIERLASVASSAYVTSAPIGITDNGMGEQMIMFHDRGHVKVFVCNGTVFMSGIEHQGYWPDWFCLRRGEARLIAQALLSAAAYVDTEDDVK